MDTAETTLRARMKPCCPGVVTPKDHQPSVQPLANRGSATSGRKRAFTCLCDVDMNSFSKEEIMGLRGPCQKEMAHHRQPPPTVPQMGSKRNISKCLGMPKPSDSSFTDSTKPKGHAWETGALVVIIYLIATFKPNTNFISSLLFF